MRIKMTVDKIAGHLWIFAYVDLPDCGIITGVACDGRSHREARVGVKKLAQEHLDD